MGCKVNTSCSRMQICKSIQIFLFSDSASTSGRAGEGGGLIVFRGDSGSTGPSSSPEPETSCCVSENNTGDLIAGAFRGVGNSHGF